MSQKTASPDVRKEQIIDAALRCFQRKGYESTSVEDIAAEYGLSKGSIYYYFDSKKEILLTVFKHMITRLLGGYESLLMSNTTARQKLVRMGKLMVRMMLRDYESYRPLMVLGSVAYEDEALREMIAQSYKTAEELIKEILAQGEKNGEFIVPNKDLISTLLIALGEGLFTRQVLINDLDIDKIEEEMTSIVDRFLPSSMNNNAGTHNGMVVNAYTRGPDGKFDGIDSPNPDWRDSDIIFTISLGNKGRDKYGRKT